MGWKLQAGIIVAVALAVGLFRKQIAEVFTSAGGAIGESIGGAVGAIPVGIQTGAQAVAGDWWKGIGDFLAGGGAAGQYFREREQQIPYETKIGGSQPNHTDRVITPSIRDYSDAGVKQVTSIVRTLGQTTTLGHAQRAEIAISAVGISPSAQFKAYLGAERARGNTMSVSELYGFWRR